MGSGRQVKVLAGAQLPTWDSNAAQQHFKKHGVETTRLRKRQHVKDRKLPEPRGARRTAGWVESSRAFLWRKEQLSWLTHGEVPETHLVWLAWSLL